MDNIEFTFSYLAMKMLGKNLYSNAWAALSELVANGFDAKAKNVFVLIDIRDKKNAIVEVSDDGEGMSQEIVRENYVRIGFNRRLELDDSDSVMGRKGIGKLAALYLSRHYYIFTKKDGKELRYKVDFPNEEEDNDKASPQLKATNKKTFATKSFEKNDHGTLIRMEQVDLTGYGESAFSSLNKTLSDFFTNNELNKQKVFVKIITSDKDENGHFAEVKKEIPLKNMTNIICFDEETFKEMLQLQGGKVLVPISGVETPLEFLRTIKKTNKTSKEFTSTINGVKKEGHIKGWIGVHATISANKAAENDPLFKKNTMYDPLKIRIYVRNKLAIANLKSSLKNTQTYANYVEGEVSFDLLDDSDFPDIATTSRQDMDENDERIKFLQRTVSEQVQDLVKLRNRVKDKANIEKRHHTDSVNTEARQSLRQTASSFISKNPDSTRQEMLDEIMKNITGAEVKKHYTIFLSHKSEDKPFVDFIFNTLTNRGVRKDEIFYTSRSDEPQVKVRQQLNDVIIRNLTQDNALIVFYFSNKFITNESTMFEAGAVLATKTTDEYLSLADNHDNIPKILAAEIGSEYTLIFDETFKLETPRNYMNMNVMMNVLLKHINEGRKIKKQKEVALFAENSLDEDMFKEWKKCISQCKKNNRKHK